MCVCLMNGQANEQGNKGEQLQSNQVGNAAHSCAFLEEITMLPAPNARWEGLERNQVVFRKQQNILFRKLMPYFEETKTLLAP